MHKNNSYNHILQVQKNRITLKFKKQLLIENNKDFHYKTIHFKKVAHYNVKGGVCFGNTPYFVLGAKNIRQRIFAIRLKPQLQHQCLP